MTLIIVVILILLALLGTSLFLVLGSIPLISSLINQEPIAVIIGEMFERLSSNPVLLAIPLFTFAGYVLAESKTPQRLVNLSNALFGWMSGGLAIVSLICCAIFTAFTGASGVTIIAIGGLLYPILIREQYPEKFTLGLLTSSGSLGLLFPPSLPIIIYGIVAMNTMSQAGFATFVPGEMPTVNNLFKACLVPGVMLLVLLSGYSWFRGKRSKVPRTPFSWPHLWLAVREMVWEIPLPVVIIWGIYGGWFTPTKAAAVTAFYVLVVEVFVYRDLSLKTDIPRIIKESMLLVGSIMMILGMAFALTNFLIDQEVPQKILTAMSTLISGKIMFLIVLNIFLLIVGSMMDIYSALAVVVPLIIPVAQQFGINPIHLGVIFLANLEIGYSTPPVGLNLFISSFRFKKPVIKLYAAALPFLAILLFALLVITYVPQLSLWLVNLFGQ